MGRVRTSLYARPFEASLEAIFDVAKAELRPQAPASSVAYSYGVDHRQQLERLRIINWPRRDRLDIIRPTPDGDWDAFGRGEIEASGTVLARVIMDDLFECSYKISLANGTDIFVPAKTYEVAAGRLTLCATPAEDTHRVVSCTAELGSSAYDGMIGQLDRAGDLTGFLLPVSGSAAQLPIRDHTSN